MFDILRNKPIKTNAISHKTCSMVICCFPLGFKALLEKQIRRKHKLFKDTSEMGANSKCLALYRMDFPGQQPPDSTESQGLLYDSEQC